jgi:hypothetical protein
MTLDEFVDEGIKRSIVHGYVPTTFMRMRNDYKTAPAIVRLVETSNPQSGFQRLKELGLLEWSLEAAVLRFPEHFAEKTRTYARARLEGTFNA